MYIYMLSIWICDLFGFHFQIALCIPDLQGPPIRRFSEVRNGRQVRLGERVDMEPAQLQAEAGRRVQVIGCLDVQKG